MVSYWQKLCQCLCAFSLMHRSNRRRRWVREQHYCWMKSETVTAETFNSGGRLQAGVKPGWTWHENTWIQRGGQDGMLNQKLVTDEFGVDFDAKSTGSSLKQEMGVSASLIIIVKNRVPCSCWGKRQSGGQLPWGIDEVLESESDVLDHIHRVGLSMKNISKVKVPQSLNFVSYFHHHQVPAIPFNIRIAK
jgi:hypothetical protein